MTTNPLTNQMQGRVPDQASETRLLEIRREAERHGKVDGKGLKPGGAPFPVASPETGYYGIPLLKQAQWTWEVPLYFFTGGAAGSAAVIGAVANFTGADKKIARDARFVAAGGALLSSALLIADLGRPERFLAMLRVFKRQSPISVGAWILAAFGSASGAAAFAQLVQDRYGVGPVRVLGNIAETFSATLGLPFHNYTGVLIGATAIPLWNRNIDTLPIHFGQSGVAAGVSVLELMGNHDSRALNMMGILASGYETWEGYHLEMRTDPALKPLRRGAAGWVTRAGGVLSGPLPLLLRLVGGRSRRIRKLAAISTVVGSILTRYGWVHAGRASARDWRLPLEIEEKAAEPKPFPERKPEKIRAAS
jgi:Polysulfide reductase